MSSIISANSYPLKRRNLAACLNRLIDWDPSNGSILKDKEFAFYHRNRNFFNNKYGSNENESRTITLLHREADGAFYDYTGRQWTETYMDYRVKGIRKFVSRDEHMEAAGYKGQCEFEMVIWDYDRVIKGTARETYNFGPTGIWTLSGIFGFRGLHDKFDIVPHRQSPDYETKYYPSNRLRIAYLSTSTNDWVDEEADDR